MAPPPSLQELIETVRRDTSSDDELDLLVTASSTVRELEELDDALLGHFVNRCRLAGRSWSEISDALGVSKHLNNAASPKVHPMADLFRR